ncbi:MAG: sn-glycerol-3-phosphate ABC transporter ATP-binding protein UgpC [Sphingomicrobium sp.]
MELDGVVKSFGTTKVIDRLSLSIRPNEFIVFLGPSGCGKSTLLRMIAGLESLDDGTISIGDQRIDQLSPGARGVAMVFQHYALYPHMTIRQNMAFGLENAGIDKGEIARRVAEAADRLEMGELLDRRPGQLSGGQKQRAAIGRAIVKQPKLFLFDEPLSNLDAKLRARTRLELAQLHQRFPSTMIFVTHDQVEAMTLADRIVVLNAGRIEQIGTPMEIYATPATAFVAGFVGSPAISMIPVSIERAGDGTMRALLGDGSAIATAVPFEAHRVGDGWRVGVRAESARIASDGGLAGTVEVVERLGDRTLAYCRLGDGSIIAAEDKGNSALKTGDTVAIAIDPAGAHLFDGEGRGHHAAH